MTLFVLPGILYKGDGENTFISQQPHVIKSIMGTSICFVFIYLKITLWSFLKPVHLRRCAAAPTVCLMSCVMHCSAPLWPIEEQHEICRPTNVDTLCWTQGSVEMMRPIKRYKKWSVKLIYFLDVVGFVLTLGLAFKSGCTKLARPPWLAELKQNHGCYLKTYKERDLKLWLIL